MSVCEAPQRSDDWHLARAGKLTGSVVAALYATRQDGKEPAARRNLRARLVQERRSTLPTASGYETRDMQRGTTLEPAARNAYEIETEQTVESVGFVTRDDLPVGCSPDGLVGDDGLIEIKCPRAKGHLETVARQAPPDAYTPQLLHNLWITGRAWVDFISYCPEDEYGNPVDPPVYIVRFRATDAERASHELLVRQFLREVDAALNE